MSPYYPKWIVCTPKVYFSDLINYPLFPFCVTILYFHWVKEISITNKWDKGSPPAERTLKLQLDTRQLLVVFSPHPIPLHPKNFPYFMRFTVTLLFTLFKTKIVKICPHIGHIQGLFNVMGLRHICFLMAWNCPFHLRFLKYAPPKTLDSKLSVSEVVMMCTAAYQKPSFELYNLRKRKLDTRCLRASLCLKDKLEIKQCFGSSFSITIWGSRNASKSQS